MKNERELLAQAMEALEAQRPTLGHEATEAALAALRARLTALASRPLERRHVTVLFGDLCGFTSMSERMDPEDVSELMNLLWEHVDAAIVRHGGRIDKHIGDAVMAIWGADGSREDDAEQALHAALDIHAQLEAFQSGGAAKGLRMRIGVHTGPVLLGVVGTLGELTVMGDTVNTAARLEQAAPEGGILISHGTWRQVNGAFEAEPLAPLKLKGKQEPLQVYRVTAARPRAFHRQGRGLEGIWARLVGREEESQLLRSALSAVLSGGGSQRITLTGEAGIGKSRLLGEFETWLESLPTPPLCLRGRASPEMRRHPNALLRDLFSFHLQVQESDQPRVVRARLEESFREALGPESSALHAHLAGSLIGYDFSDSPHLKGTSNDEQSLRARGLASLSEYFRALLAREPMVLFLEDVHWADDSALDLLERLLQTLAPERLLVLCTARPEFFERRPDWAHAPSHTRLELRPLSQEDSHRLVAELLRKVENIPPALHELVLSRAEGNPFYLEELIQMLLEEGVILAEGDHWRVEPRRLTALKVPPTLSGVLQSRLDSLPAHEREVLQRASVVGRLFWDEALSWMGGNEDPPTRLHEALTALQERELIFEQSNPAFAGTREYIFKHAIVREVAYESVLKRERRTFHGRVAQWLLARGGERSREHLGLIADHLEASGQGVRAAIYLRRAGEEALSLFANAEARAFLERALALAPETDPVEHYAIVAAHEKVHAVMGERNAQRQDLDALESLAEQLGDPWRRVEAALRRALYATEVGELTEGAAAVHKAILLAQEIGDVGSEALGHLRWGRMLRHHQGDFDRARHHFERSLTLAESARLPQIEVESLLNLSAVIHETGDLDASLAYVQRVLPFCRSMGDRWLESSAQRHQGYVLKNLGDFAGARAALEQTLQFSRVIGYRFWECADLCNLALIRYHQGDVLTALELSEQALRLAQDIGSTRHQGYAWMSRGHALASLGRLPEAREAYQQARTLRAQAHMLHLEMESVAGLAAVALAAGALPEALGYAEELLAHLERGPLQGVEEPFTPWLTCYRVFRAQKDSRAHRVLEKALRHLQEWSGRIRDERLRSLFLALPANHALLTEGSASASVESSTRQGDGLA